MRRPLAYSGASFFLTLLLVNIFGVNFGVSIGILFLFASMFIGFLPYLKRLRMWAIPIFCGFLASTVFCLGMHIFATPIENELSGKTLNVEATLVDLPSQGVFPVYTVKSDISFPDGKTRSVKYKFYSAETINCKPYDVMICTIKFSKLDDDYSDYNYAKNIFIKATLVSEVRVITPKDKPFMYNILKMRQQLISVVMNTFDEQSAGLICGIMTGDTDCIPHRLKDNIRICGLSHISAVSGLHISILASFLLIAFQKIGVKKRHSYILILVPIWLFVLVVGSPYSAIRSAFMFSVMALGIGLFYHSDPFSSLFGSLMLCGLVSPFCALDVGLLSSASATLGLLIFTKSINDWMLLKIPSKLRKNKIVKYIIGSFAQTTSAVLGLIPCMLLFYKNFSNVVLISNLLVLPLVTVLLFCSLLGGLLSSVSVISNPFLFVAGISSKIIIFICNTLSKIPFAEISIAKDYLVVALCGVLVLFMVDIVMLTLNKGGGRLISILLVMSILCFGVSALSYNIVNGDKAEIYVPDDGDNIYALVVYKGETTLVCGELGYSSSAKIYSTLKSTGHTKIDCFVVQEDISRGMLESLTNKIEVKEYFVHKEIEENFPFVATKNSKINFVTNTFTTQKGVKIDLNRNRSEMLVSVGNFSALMLNRNLDFEKPSYKFVSVVITKEESLNKLKNLTYYDVICSCENENTDNVLRFFKENNIDGVCTAGYGSVRVWASKEGGYSLSRTK